MKNGEDDPGRGTSVSGSTGPQCHTAVIWDRQKDAWKNRQTAGRGHNSGSTQPAVHHHERQGD